MQLRAYQDWHIRNAILCKAKQIVVPRMTIGQADFWLNYSKRIDPNFAVTFIYDDNQTLAEYILDKPVCLGYSHGLESSLIAMTLPNAPKLSIKDYFPWTDPIEGAIAIAGAGLGYRTVLYGGELYDGGSFKEEENLCGWEYELTAHFAQQWLKYSGSFLYSPFWPIEKSYLANRAIKEDVQYNSCVQSTNDPNERCGICHKCIADNNYRKIFSK